MTTTTTKTGRKPGRPRKVVDTPIKKLPNNPLAFEVLDLASKQRSVNKKVEVLKTYEHVSLKMLFLWNFDAAVESALPPGEVPYESYGEQTSSSGTLSKKIDMQTRSSMRLVHFPWVLPINKVGQQFVENVRSFIIL